MSCCGGKRGQYRPATGTQGSADAVGVSRFQARPAAEAVTYEYVGQTGLTVQGPITGRRYRFNRPGARVAVDGRDSPSLAAVPHLQKVPDA